MLTFAKRALGTFPRNAQFRSRHPGFAVPPLYLLWDAQSHTDYALYKHSGEETAAAYWELIRSHVALSASVDRHVCEWGCGPGRVIRHLPALSQGYPIRFYATTTTAGRLPGASGTPRT
jgi:hypothetical protein